MLAHKRVAGRVLFSLGLMVGGTSLAMSATQGQRLRPDALTLSEAVMTTAGQKLGPGVYDVEVGTNPGGKLILSFYQKGAKVGETAAEMKGFPVTLKVNLAGFLCDASVPSQGKASGFQCNGRGAVPSQGKASGFSCDGRAAVPSQGKASGFECNGKTAVPSQGKASGFSCDAKPAPGKASFECNEGRSNKTSAGPGAGPRTFAQLGFGLTSPVLFDASKKTISIIAGQGEFAGRGSIKATLAPAP